MSGNRQAAPTASPGTPSVGGCTAQQAGVGNAGANVLLRDTARCAHSSYPYLLAKPVLLSGFGVTDSVQQKRKGVHSRQFLRLLPPFTGTCIIFGPGRRLFCVSVLCSGFGALDFEDAARSKKPCARLAR